ncbi:hypothetical protein HGM15179_020910, partial [Zosterops borbonicus]
LLVPRAGQGGFCSPLFSGFPQFLFQQRPQGGAKAESPRQGHLDPPELRVHRGLGTSDLPPQ